MRSRDRRRRVRPILREFELAKEMLVKDRMTDQMQLWIVDVQERFVDAMEQDALERAVRTIKILIELAAEVGAQIVYTEHYPQGLGPTIEDLRSILESRRADRFEKVHFDAIQSPACELNLDRDAIVCGLEAHVCVRATALSLRERGNRVLVPFDGVVSREPEYASNGLARMREEGIVVTNRESIVFDTLESAQAAGFKRFSKMIR